MSRKRLFNFAKLLRITQALILLAAGSYLIWTDALWSWNQLFYDWQIRQSSRPVPQDIVIIGIDDLSLYEIGRWPWSRRIHAKLLDKLNDANSKAVFFDVIFAEPDQNDPAGDQQFITSVKNYGRVVLPVVVDQLQQDGQLIEVLPFPELAAAGVHFGHADIDLDRDGIARSVYLQAGLGEPVWLHVALTLLELAEPESIPDPLPGLRNPDSHTAALYQWIRDHQIWIPFAGPPGHFQRYSYADVLRSDFDLSQLHDKIVLVGLTTSTGMDDLPTPVSGQTQTMPGVEIIANVLDSVRQDLGIQPLARPWLLLEMLIVVAIMLIMLTRYSPGIALFLTVLMQVLVVLISIVALHIVKLWIAPVGILLMTIVTYTWWSWQRLESTVRYLNQELNRLGNETTVSTYTNIHALKAELKFLRSVFNLQGYQLLDHNGATVLAWGQPLQHQALLRQIESNNSWLQQDHEYWGTAWYEGQPWHLGIVWPDEQITQQQQHVLLDNLLRQTHRPDRQNSWFSPLELVQHRIQQVQTATERMRSMRRFIQDSLEQMADGVIVTNSLGRVLLANAKAADYLNCQNTAELIDQSLQKQLEVLDPHTPGGWPKLLRQVLLQHQPLQIEASGNGELALLVQIAPFAEQADIGDGLIVNFADISALKASERRRLEMLNFMSHDLRSPIISIIAITQLADATQDGSLPPDSLNHIRIAARKTLTLAEDFLQLARAESNDAYQLDAVDLIFVADSAIEQVIPQAESKDSQIISDFKVDEAWLMGEGNLLERMLVNLLTNAIKYSQSGAKIQLGIEQRDKELLCWVQDNGSGIAKHDIPKLFDRFKRLDRKEHRKERGAGLGLSFVKTVVDNHNGRIEVQSELNQGTRFIVYFPALEISKQQALSA